MKYAMPLRIISYMCSSWKSKENLIFSYHSVIKLCIITATNHASSPIDHILLFKQETIITIVTIYEVSKSDKVMGIRFLHAQ